MSGEAEASFRKEFERQVVSLLSKNYPKAAGITPEAFVARLEPLTEWMPHLAATAGASPIENAPFVLVIKNDLTPTDKMISLVELNGKAGSTVFDAGDLARFKPTDDVEIPDAPAYLLVDIDTGKDTLNVAPDEAMTTIERRQRSPLTIDEGIALVTHYPERLKKNNCFSLLGSRCGDRRVPALWISGECKPHLGWCWAGNPHTWLGSASCGSRIGPGT